MKDVRKIQLIVIAVLLISCGGSASARDAQPVTLRLGYFPNVTHGPAMAGIRQGYFTGSLGSRGTLKTSTFNAGPEAVEALLSDSIDASYIGPNPAVNAFVQSHGKAVRVVAGATSGGAALVVRPAMSSPADLRGKTIATPQLGNTQDVALRWWLAQRGLKAQLQGGGDVHIIPQDNAQTLQTFRAGQVDGAWVPEPWASRLVIEGGGKILVDERDLWPQGRFASTLLLVRTDFLQAHKDVVRRLIEGQFKAIAYLNQNPLQAQGVVNAALADLSGKRLSDSVVSSAWGRMQFTNDPLMGTVRSAAAHAHEVGILARVDLRGLADVEILNEVLAGHGQPKVAA